ncbi:MAG: ABC transporter permease [Pseudonocardia sp.]|nr:ABC transporter permease [Pseudonocardia sp.]
MALVGVHYRFLLLEQVRIPIALLSSALFPALSLLFFVVPFDYAADPLSATTAVVQLTVFAVMSSFLFTFGVGVADDREKSWDPYLRTLPASAWPRIAGRLLSGATFALVSVVPVLVVGALFTSASMTPVQLLLGLVALFVAGMPFLFGGLTIGYSLPVKVALPVTQLIFFPIAFAGGLLIPPTIFPGWLQTVSALLPSRGARDLVVWATTGAAPDVLALAVFAGWTVATAGLAVWAYRRDEGRRFA